MLKVTDLSYEFPQKDLYHKISFSIEDGQHCVLIGTNGTGKSTLIRILAHPDEYLYDGKIEMEANQRIGFVNQFLNLADEEDCSVFCRSTSSRKKLMISAKKWRPEKI